MSDPTGGGASVTTEDAAGSSNGTDVSLDRFLSTRISYESRLVRWGGTAIVALGLFAWSEIQRRLEILNHENARLLAQQEKTVSQDTYTANESQRKEEQLKLDEWRKSVDHHNTESVSRTELRRETKTESRAGIGTATAVIAACVGLVVVILAILNYQALHSGGTVVPTRTVTVPR